MDPAEREVFEIAKDGVIVANEAGMIVHCNRAAAEAMGRNRLPLGEALESIMPTRLRGKHRQGFGRYVQTGESHLEGKTVRVPALAADGSEREIDLTIRIFRRPDGSKLAVAGVKPASDIQGHEDLLRIESRLVARAYQLV